ncbi:MAG: hypothetical protein PVF52_00420 [Granulosicoccaceae bacterium]|jgi:hypothetical protein
MKRLFAFAAAISVLVVFGPDLINLFELNRYRDTLTALLIALILQPWIISQLEN